MGWICVIEDRGEGLAVLSTEIILCVSYCAGILGHIFRKDLILFILLIPSLVFM
jgi:hypothetical protein